jgi:hypothetical protein
MLVTASAVKTISYSMKPSRISLTNIASPPLWGGGGGGERSPVAASPTRTRTPAIQGHLRDHPEGRAKHEGRTDVFRRPRG